MTQTMKFWGAAALSLALAACSGGPARVASTPTPAVSTAGEVDRINDLLLAGDTGGARKALKAVLKREPMNANALLLRDSVERDPKELLGPQSYPYAVRSGDTITGLATRLLGNRLKAYQLARYNDLTAPYALAPGQSLRIPGTPPRPEPVRSEPVRRPEPAPAKPAPAPKPTAAKPAAPAANPVLARQLRTAGLAALNQGNVARAVAMLRRAAAADPGNPAIAADLARAERIAATVRARQ
ncbi:LysM peptidoglycan-binding domain-containing protein [Sphingomonas donggukensis]|uniref:LysM peptidoglycan-binding domain-containing protein n=1 Tax=Sphingomonas donggukensis TaxID=2949093 RepID=A0ABY4TT42_9SPHN|nr:LysM peptidoglycan-binding domain-containing protein [Sphingomonas donggukensis]URW75114.1 LysM peptidoglycan-binding domain-containing protein [Sphingomonas donggukensis]